MGDNNEDPPEPDGFQPLSRPRHPPPSPPISTRPRLLPLEQLHWEDFEGLCEHVATRIDAVENVRRYGINGQVQEGVDLLARLRGQSSYACWQCKRYASVKAQDLSAAVSRFLEGSWAAKASVFYFCTSASLAHRTLVAEIETQALRLRERNIRFVSLGKEELSKALRNHPDIVEIFFGGYWADAFCARTGWQTDDVLTNLWRAPPETPEPLLLLDWRLRLSECRGRTRELSGLIEWAQSGDALRVRLVTGPGGAGKTRLAAELCELLRQRGWYAGFLKSGMTSVTWPKAGASLLVIDYPEERGAELASLFERLSARADSVGPRRIVLLSREDEQWWRTRTALRRTRVAQLLDTVNLELHYLTEQDAVAVFQQVARRLREQYQKTSPLVADAAVAAWFRNEKELHRLPLLVVAAAVHSVLCPEATLRLGGQALVRALISRERDRSESAAEAVGFAPHSASRLRALASIPGELDAARVKKLADPRLEIGCPPPERIIDALFGSSLWQKNAIRAPDAIPDLFTAALLFEVLSERQDVAPEWLWAAIEHREEEAYRRLARIIYDIKIVFGPKESRLEKWLMEMIRARPDRASNFAAWAESRRPPTFLLPFAIAVSESLVDRYKGQEPQQSLWRTHLAHHLWDARRCIEAIAVIDAVIGAPGEKPAIPKLLLADALHARSLILDERGRKKEALASCDEAIALWRGPALEGDVRARSGLVQSLNQRALLLEDSREGADALREALATCRELAKDDAPELSDHRARVLFNLSMRETDATRALELIRESVEVRRGLVSKEPWRYEAGLALSLHECANRLGNAKRFKEAIPVIAQALEIREKMAQVNPPRFGEFFLESLWLKTALSTRADDREAILEVADDAVRCEKLFDEGTLNDDELLTHLAKVYGQIGYQLAGTEDGRQLGSAVCTSAVKILERLKEKEPGDWTGLRHYLLAGLYLNRGNTVFRSDRAAALQDYSAAIEIVEKGRARFGFVANAEVAREIALANHANEKLKDGLYEEAYEDCQRLIETERNTRLQLGARWPLDWHLELNKSLSIVARRLREKFPETALALWELRLEIQNGTADSHVGTADRVETLKSLLALGLEYLTTENREKASSYLGRGVSQVARIIDEWSDGDGTPYAKADLINTMNCYVSRSFEHAARLELMDLTRAEQWQRECLRLLENGDANRTHLWGAARSTLGSILCNLASSSGDRSWAVRAQEVLEEALVFFQERNDLEAILQVRDEIRAARIAAEEPNGTSAAS